MEFPARPQEMVAGAHSYPVAYARIDPGRDRRLGPRALHLQLVLVDWRFGQSNVLREIAERNSQARFGFEDGRAWLEKGILRDQIVHDSLRH